MSKQQEKIEQARKSLMAYAIDWLATWSSQEAGDLPADPASLKPYWARLAGYSPAEKAPDGPITPPGAALLSIFSRVQPPTGDPPPQRYWQPQLLSLDEVPKPKKQAQALPGDREALWAGFDADLKKVPEGDAQFEAFGHLLHRWAWAVPCRYGEAGVSLYDEFRALSALVHASRGADKPAAAFTLVGGDIPGIQDFVYTITSKGAAKGLRGRSFFVQLLGDAVVRRLLAALELPETNVIYAAGGNFMLLAPGGEEAQATRAVVDTVQRRVNGLLARAIQGDTALALETMVVKTGDLFVNGRFKDVREDFGIKMAQAKGRPLKELAGVWETLFEPQGRGSDLSCAVCRIEVDEYNSKPLEETGEEPEVETGTAEPPRICYVCDSFAELARDIRHKKLWVVVKEVPAMLESEDKPGDGWAELLARMTGWSYAFHDETPQGVEGLLAVNQPKFLEAEASGFRLLANVTPRTTPEDVEHLRKAGVREEQLPAVGDIRSFGLLAQAAAGAGAIERVGVLRMDVDGLGWVFSEGVQDLTLPRLGALSGAMDRFFGGYLNPLVRDVGGNDLYIIYAGGDDLFVVGAWHHLPALAETIRHKFKTFSGQNPALSLSGGITLEGAKFPLYRAAERAGEAEGRAKGHTRPDGQAKDALCFLDTVVGWEDWELVRSQKDELLWLIGEDKENRAALGEERAKRLPRRLLQLVQGIHSLYQTGLQDARRETRKKNRGRPPDKKLEMPQPQMFLGRWAWMRVYSLTRMADRGKKDVPDAQERIETLQKQIIQPATVRFSGLAARWAEYEIRKEAES